VALFASRQIDPCSQKLLWATVEQGFFYFFL